QLVVDDPTSKGSKRKNQEEPTRISIQVPKKGENVTAEGDAADDLLGPAKKKRLTKSTTGRSLLHQGGNSQNLTAGGDTVAQELTEVVAEKFQVPPPVC
ncbi:hypothetical protein A2U01_0072781, partial [Trifolium medium]|nr:hypothetical protein [Trifolium medium]